MIKRDKSKKNIIRLDQSQNVFYCKICKKRLKKYSAAIKHYSQVHNMLAGLFCTDCDETFNSLVNLGEHKDRRHNKTDPYSTCLICQIPFYTRFRLETHVKKCHVEKFCVCTCKLCGMKFPLKQYLEMHMDENHNEDNYECDVCDKKFQMKKYFLAHVKALHSDGKLPDGLKCTNCDKKMANKRDTLFHISKCTGVKPKAMDFFDCSECPEWFKNKREMDMHFKRIHTRARDYPCEFCTYRAFSRVELMEHSNTHSAIKIYQCTKCEEGFNFRSALQKHINTHHAKEHLEVQLICSVCKLDQKEILFPSRKALAKHMLEFHNQGDGTVIVLKQSLSEVSTDVSSDFEVPT